ncbi:hypothetical protein, partial [Rhizobium sp. SSA_523]|uniref:hypothetical protein n=1 Tax=Rhizobium sp. SSA_523 TaxID=2952477 RepID=UPI002091C6B1
HRQSQKIQKTDKSLKSIGNFDSTIPGAKNCAKKTGQGTGESGWRQCGCTAEPIGFSFVPPSLRRPPRLFHNRRS